MVAHVSEGMRQGLAVVGACLGLAVLLVPLAKVGRERWRQAVQDAEDAAHHAFLSLQEDVLQAPSAPTVLQRLQAAELAAGLPPPLASWEWRCTWSRPISAMGNICCDGDSDMSGNSDVYLAPLFRAQRTRNHSTHVACRTSIVGGGPEVREAWGLGMEFGELRSYPCKAWMRRELAQLGRSRGMVRRGRTFGAPQR